MAEEAHRATIRNPDATDEPQIVELLFCAFQQWPAFPIEVPPIEHLRWKLRSDPIASRHQWVAEIDQRIAAMTLRILFRVRVRGRDYLAREEGDAAVDPRYQGRGLYRALLDYIYESPRDDDFSLTFWFSTNPRTRRAGRVEDGQLLGNPIRALEKPYDARTIVARRREKYGGRLPARLAVLRIGLDKAINRLLHPSYLGRPGWEGSIATLERFDDRIGGFFEEAARSFDFIVVRSKDYLNWRYCDPAAGCFTIRAAEQEGRLLGYLVLKVAEGEGFIADLLALPGRSDVVRSLLEDALRLFRASGVERVTCWMILRHPYNGILRRYGFFNSRKDVGCRYRTLSLDRSELAFLADAAARIHLTHGDSDWI